MDKKKEIFEDLPVMKALATLAIPTILSQLVTMIYNLADTFYIGQTKNPYMVAGVSLCFSVFFILMAVGNLFGIGGGSLVSRKLGAKRPEEAKHISAFSFWTGVAFAAVFSIVVYFNMDRLLYTLGASEKTISWARDYLFWVVCVGGVPTIVGVLMGHLLRSEGYAKYSSIGIAFGGVLNIILDPIFIFVFHMAVKGAAIATMISNVFAMAYYFMVIIKLGDKTVLSISFKNYRLPWQEIKLVLSVGFPAALATILASVSSSLFNKMAAGYGDISLAAIGIVKKIDMIPMSVGIGLTQGMLPLMAYNYAAKNYKRMDQVNKYGRYSAYAVSAFCIIIFQLIPSQMVRFFIDDPETIRIGAKFLRVDSIGVPLMLTNFMMNTTFQAMGKGLQSFIMTSCRQGLIAIPLMFMMNGMFGLFGLIWTQPIADTLTVIISFTLYVGIMKILRRESEEYEARLGGEGVTETD